MPKAEILCVGNELLNGRTVNTNASEIARELSKRGVKTTRIVTVGDRREDIASSLRDSLDRGVGYVFVCGGLGPTYDDKTAESVAEALDRDTFVSREALRWIAKGSDRDPDELSEPLRKMATVPRGAEVHRNDVGDAPGISLETDGTRIFVLPGVPEEMRFILETHFSPSLGRGEARVSESIASLGLREADLAPLLDEFRRRHPKVYVKTHVKADSDRVEIELSSWSASKEDVESVAEELKDSVRSLGGRFEGKRS